MPGGEGSPLRSAAAHAFVADLSAPALEEEDRHHLERVLRLRAGQVVTVADGAGGWRCCTWRAGAELEPAGEVVREPAPSPPVTVGFALTKGERPDWAVQKLTEVGVDRIVALATARSVVRLDATAAQRRVQRWRRVAREAAMQSRRTTLPTVEGVVAVGELVEGGPGGFGVGVALAEPGGAPPSLRRAAVLVGPEGGWSPDELSCGLPTVGLGASVLRTETAALVAGVLLCSLRAGLAGETTG